MVFYFLPNKVTFLALSSAEPPEMRHILRPHRHGWGYRASKSLVLSPKCDSFGKNISFPEDMKANAINDSEGLDTIGTMMLTRGGTAGRRSHS